MAYLIFAISFIIRLIYIIQLKSSVVYSWFVLDEAFYNNWARQIAAGDWLGNSAFNALPLYPYMLGAIYKLSGSSLFLPRLLEAAVGSACCSLIYILAKRFFGKAAALAAGLIAALYAPFIFYSGLLVPTTFALFFYLLALLLLLNLAESPSPLRFFIFGMACGIAALTRASVLLFLPAALVWLAAVANDKKKAALGGLLSLLGVLIIILPVTVRNYAVCGEIIPLTSHAGINFYIGNNEEADGRFKEPLWARSSIDGLQQDSKTIAEQAMDRRLSDSEVSDYYFKKALSFIKSHPLKFLRLLGTKLFLFINALELYDVAHYQAYSEVAPVLKFPFLGFFIIGPLGIAGMIMALRQIRRLAPLYIFAVSYAITILLYFVNSALLPC